MAVLLIYDKKGSRTVNAANKEVIKGLIKKKNIYTKEEERTIRKVNSLVQ